MMNDDEAKVRAWVVDQMSRMKQPATDLTPLLGRLDRVEASTKKVEDHLNALERKADGWSEGGLMRLLILCATLVLSLGAGLIALNIQKPPRPSEPTQIEQCTASCGALGVASMEFNEYRTLKSCLCRKELPTTSASAWCGDSRGLWHQGLNIFNRIASLEAENDALRKVLREATIRAEEAAVKVELLESREQK